MPKKLPRSTASSTIVRRKTQLEPYMIPLVEKLVRDDMLPMTHVAGYLGVSKETLKRWREIGEDPNCEDPLYQEFAATILRARAEMTQSGIAMLRAHAPTDHRALLELLRAADPETWVHRTNVKVETEVKHSHAVDLSKLSNEEIDQYERLLRLASGD